LPAYSIDIPKFFNTAGPCDERWHYMLPPLPRLPDAPKLVDRGQYFVVHAPRQSGKTTALRALARKLQAEGRYAAVLFSCETGQRQRDDIGEVESVLIGAIRSAAQDQLPPAWHPPDPVPSVPVGLQFNEYLRGWAKACPRPVVLLADEIDALQGEALNSVLRQLRAGFANRPEGFPWSVVLCGLRDVRDYKAAAGGDPSGLGTASPFNIKVHSFTLEGFTASDVRALLEQHTTATGQRFTDEAVARIHALAQGQPWLTNALAAEVVDRLGVTGDVTTNDIDAAKERLILARATHLDSLLARLHEPRVRRVVDPIVAGGHVEPGDAYDDDLAYARDLGLVRLKPLEIANPIYREIIIRVLSAPAEERVQTDLHGRFVHPDGRLDFDGLLAAFVPFWLQHGALLQTKLGYREAAAQLVLMAFLQRIVNGSGFLEREVGVGRGRVDLLIRWPLGDARWQNEALEVKVRTEHTGDPTEEGLAQLDAYLDRLGLDHGALVIFDRRTPPSAGKVEHLSMHTPQGRAARVLRV
jgi:hypothetical protein